MKELGEVIKGAFVVLLLALGIGVAFFASAHIVGSWVGIAIYWAKRAM